MSQAAGGPHGAPPTPGVNPGPAPAAPGDRSAPALPRAVSLPSAAPRQRHPIISLARELVPWLVVIASLLWIGHTVRWRELYVIARGAPIGRVVGGSILFLLLNCAADTFATQWTFRWFGCRVPFGELYVVRAATYLVAIVQYYVGQAALVAYLHQRKRIPVVHGTAWILFMSGINMGVLLLLAAAGLFLVGPSVPWPWLTPAAVGITVAIVLYAALLQWHPPALARITLLAPLFQMGIVGHVKATLVRLPHVLLLVTWHYAMMNAFGVAVPPLVALALLPAMFFATALPISVQGVGPTQYVAVLFFSRYSPQGSAGVLAYSLGTMSISVLLQAAMGLAFLAAGRKLGVPEHPIEEVEREAEEDELGEAQRAAIGNSGGDGDGDAGDLSQASSQI